MRDFIKIEGGWEGLDELAAIKFMAELIRDGLKAVEDAGNYFVGEIKTTLTGTRTGRSYKVSKTGKLHVASRAGGTGGEGAEAPAVLFGHLRNSIGKTNAELVDGNTIQLEVGVGLGRTKANTIAPNYARRLEWGGVDSRGVRILPRPYMEPTARRVTPIIDRMLEEGVGG